MMPDMDYESTSIQLHPGDRLFLYSDGITECENESGEQFGQDRLLACLKDSFSDSLEQTVARIEQQVRDWNHGESFEDDVTFLILEWKP